MQVKSIIFINNFVENDESWPLLKEGIRRMGKGLEKKKKRWRLFGGLTALIVLIFIVCDARLKTVFYTVESDKIEHPVRIALITDLHSDKYGKNQSTLIRAVEKQNPDVVLLCGDIFDDNGTYDNAEITIRQLAEKYPCYYVTGNHEYWSRDVGTILDIVKACGVTILSGNCDTILLNGQTINICGVDDPDVARYLAEGVPIEVQLTQAQEEAIAAGTEYYTILLSHRPELYETYQNYSFDLVLSGHAHGGQWRIPGILNGLYAPNQGLFPEYAGGRYDYATGTMIVSRGLARESTPIPRIFNRPELVIIDIE